MRLKIFIIASFLAISSALFPDAELEILPKFGILNSVNKHHSLGANLTLGLHFGKR